MTPAREHYDAFPAFDVDGPDWSQRSAFGFRGVPWWAAVLLAALLTAIGTVLDVDGAGKPGAWFTGSYVVGCLLAVVLVQRRSVFGPMVQPPLVLAIVMPLVVLVSGHNSATGTAARAFSVAAPMISSFPAMASTTGVAVVIGLLRIFFQRLPEDETDLEAAPTRRAPRAGARQAPPDRAAGRQSQDAARAGRARPGADRRGAAGRQDGRAGGRTPGRARAGEAAPERGDRATPPGRGSGGRQTPGAPGGGQRAVPPRRPRRPPREDFWE